MPFKKVGVFSVFEKTIRLKGKNFNISVSRAALCTQKKLIFACKKFFWKNVCLSTDCD